MKKESNFKHSLGRHDGAWSSRMRRQRKSARQCQRQYLKEHCRGTDSGSSDGVQLPFKLEASDQPQAECGCLWTGSEMQQSWQSLRLMRQAASMASRLNRIPGWWLTMRKRLLMLITHWKTGDAGAAWDCNIYALCCRSQWGICRQHVLTNTIRFRQ